MSKPTYFLTLDSSGNVTGGGYTPDGTLPSGAVVCTQTQAQDSARCTVSGTTVTLNPAPAPTVPEEAQAALAAGLPCTSSTTNALNATYPLTDAMQNNLIALDHYYGKFNTFPNKATTVQLQDITGAAHTFSYAQFEALLQTLGDYRAALLDCIAGFSTTPPDPANFGTLP